MGGAGSMGVMTCTAAAAGAIRAGLAYFVVVFAAGFALGTFGVFLLIPHLGETVAVLAELPVVLTISWFVCRWLTRSVGCHSPAGSRRHHGRVRLPVVDGGRIRRVGSSLRTLARGAPRHLPRIAGAARPCRADRLRRLSADPGGAAATGEEDNGVPGGSMSDDRCHRRSVKHSANGLLARDDGRPRALMLRVKRS